MTNMIDDFLGDFRTVVWFSCGVTSAVAAKIAVQNRSNVVVAYCDVGGEHPDNARFLKDIEVWLNHEILILKSDKYEDIWDVFHKTRYLAGVGGARCTTELKKKVRQSFQKASDEQVFGFDAGEYSRIEKFKENNPEVKLWAPLYERGVSKSDCLHIIQNAGIELPMMYRLGYRNNNCIGCVKGQAGYWNKIRVDFPEVFDRMAKLERELNVALNKKYVKGKRVRVFLDELDPSAGNYKEEPDTGCGIACGETLEEIEAYQISCET